MAERIEFMINLLKKGIHAPFMLYSDDVMQKLIETIPQFEQSPEQSVVEVLPNRGRVYFGEDIQMVTLLK